MHPPVRWNVLSDGQPDNSTSLQTRMWSGGKSTCGLCTARSSLQVHALGQTTLCVAVCGAHGMALKPHSSGQAKELGNHLIEISPL
jgi:hypothetical protein